MKLQTKILAGYLVLVAVICSMAAILVHERGRMHEIETEAGEIQEIRRDITVAQRNIITLATLGEGVIGWEEADYRHYRIRRLRTDSLLQAMKPRCKDFVHPAQIDTLRALLVEKEAHLLHLMETFARQDKADSLLVNHLPEVAKRATRVRTVTQKKKGIAGAFGGKKTVQILPSAKELHQFSDSLHAGRADGRYPVARRTIPLADSRCHPQRGGRRSAAVGRTADPCQRERGRHGLAVCTRQRKRAHGRCICQRPDMRERAEITGYAYRFRTNFVILPSDKLK